MLSTIHHVVFKNTASLSNQRLLHDSHPSDMVQTQSFIQPILTKQALHPVAQACTHVEFNPPADRWQQACFLLQVSNFLPTDTDAQVHHALIRRVKMNTFLQWLRSTFEIFRPANLDQQVLRPPSFSRVQRNPVLPTETLTSKIFIGRFSDVFSMRLPTKSKSPLL